MAAIIVFGMHFTAQGVIPLLPMRILLIKTSSLGDVIHNLPVATDLRARFPDAAIDWVVEEAFADVVRLHPGVRRVLPVAIRRWRGSLLAPATWSEMRAFRAALQQERYDLVLDTQGLLKSALLARMARGRRCNTPPRRRANPSRHASTTPRSRCRRTCTRSSAIAGWLRSPPITP
jgi:lipopolysaccharide heptosyltransferase I